MNYKNNIDAVAFRNETFLSFEAEVIAIILNKPELAYEVINELSSEDFENKTAKHIFEIIKNYTFNNKIIEVKELISILSENETFDKDIDFLKKGISVYSGSTNLDSIIKILKFRKNKSKANNLTKEFNEKMKKLSPRNSDEFTEYLNKFHEEFSNLNFNNEKKSSFSKVSDSIKNVLVNIMNRKEDKGLTGVTTGWTSLNKITSGWQKGDLIILAGRPSMGKTAFSLNLALNASKEKNVFFFSLEMPEEQISQRMLATESNVDLNLIRMGGRETIDNILPILNITQNNMSNYNLYINDNPGISLIEIENILREEKKQNNIDICFIDYLQLITTDYLFGESKNNEIARLSKGLKKIARELEIPIVCLSQLSRNVEKREDKRPMMSDLRDSGAIEQDADIIALLYRENYYLKPDENTNNDPKNDMTELIISKHRNGSTGSLNFIFNKTIGKFNEYL